MITQAQSPSLSCCATPQAKTPVRATSPTKTCHLPPQPPNFKKKTLVLDLDETLVHSAFQPVDKVDLILPIDIDGTQYYVYVLKRPGVDDFLQRVSKFYEVVIFTASLSKYADPLISLIDPHHCTSYRLFREHCVPCNNAFVKDLNMLGRKLESTIIVDNSPNSYLFQPENALPILTWIDDFADKSLYELVPILESLANLPDVRKGLAQIVSNGKIDYVEALKAFQRPKETVRQSKKETAAPTKKEAVSAVAETTKKIKDDEEITQPAHQQQHQHQQQQQQQQQQKKRPDSAKVRSSTPATRPTIQPELPQRASNMTVKIIPIIGINSPKASSYATAATTTKGPIIARPTTTATDSMRTSSPNLVAGHNTDTKVSPRESSESRIKNLLQKCTNTAEPMLKLKSDKLAQLYASISAARYASSSRKTSADTLMSEKRKSRESLGERPPSSININTSSRPSLDLRTSLGKNLLCCGTPKEKRAFSVKKEHVDNATSSHSKENSSARPIGKLLFNEKSMASTMTTKSPWSVLAPATTRHSTAVILKPNSKPVY